jgi:hypothetical protein
MNVLYVYTADGDFEIQEDEPVTNALLRKLGMSRADLHRCFAEGMELMKGSLATGAGLLPIDALMVSGRFTGIDISNPVIR